MASTSRNHYPQAYRSKVRERRITILSFVLVGAVFGACALAALLSMSS
ncbi:hypothetical protein HZF05_01935 [Sphingomonas sp. CGMCC 1.13654]|uniref:Uncharacterized protein n=1 Tax=Sphingomonas chungangi TaxID=2683589 RepID=A0A838L1C0_9SPHN|nr:hypothetical protein [Sphingomonas chungangi]MBA2932847.1 hypothetical protein [Sphingomonas chungangi]MVW56468.1 hypothetical protein [Sphingomonas chungangi]